MKYYEHKRKLEENLNDFPIFYAFSNEQFNEGLKKLGIKPEEINEKLLRISNGSFIKKSDAENFFNLFKEHEEEFKKLMENDEFALDAFHYELSNHEYCITYDYTDTLNALGYTYKKISTDKRLYKLLIQAKNDYLNNL